MCHKRITLFVEKQKRGNFISGTTHPFQERLREVLEELKDVYRKTKIRLGIQLKGKGI